MRLGIWTPLPHTVRPDPAMTQAIAALREPGGNGPDLSYSLALELVQRAEQCGFDITLIAERFMGPDLEAWMLSAALAAQTSRIQIMTAVHPGIVTPQVVAKMGASLDRISGGRFAINIVNGWWEDEFNLYGNGAWIEGSDARYRRMDEFMQVMKGLWTQDRFSLDGEFYQCRDGVLPTRPCRLPPIYTASRDGRGKDIIARDCDFWFVSNAPGFRRFEENLSDITAAIADMRTRAARHDRQIGYGINPQVVIADTMEQAAALAEEFEQDGTRDRMSRLVATALGIGLVGTPEVIAERIRRYEAAGVDLMMLRFFPMLDGLNAFADRVMPLLDRAPACLTGAR